MGSESGLFVRHFKLKIINNMKKFFSDNMWWIMIVALLGVGYCVWTIRKGKDEPSMVEDTAA